METGLLEGSRFPRIRAHSSHERARWEEVLGQRYGIFRWKRESVQPRQVMTSAWDALKKNLLSGITVSLVSLPLSISLAVAADATPVMGITTAAWAGLMSAIFGGSSFNILGPTGALSGILSMYSIRYGLDVLPFLAIATGILLLLCWVLRLDRYSMFMPSSVIQGFSCGVAIIIAFSQLAYALGLPKLQRHESFIANVWEAVKNLDQTNPFAVLYTVVFVATLLVLPKRWPRIPWQIVVAVFGIIIGFISSHVAFGYKLDTLYDRYGELKPNFLATPTFRASFFGTDTLSAAASVTLVALMETLISAKIAARVTGIPFNQPREVLGCALANIVSGVAGGVPATAALARTSLNIRSGGTSRMSAAVNAVMVIVWSSALLFLFKYLILPAIAAILVVVGVRMVESEEIVHIYKHDKGQFAVFLLSTALVVVLDPTTGLVISSVIGLLLLARVNSEARGRMSVRHLDELRSTEIRDGDLDFQILDASIERGYAHGTPPSVEPPDVPSVLVYHISGDLTYLNAPKHCERASLLARAYSMVVVNVEGMTSCDCDGRDALGQMMEAFCQSSTSGKVLLCGVNTELHETLNGYGWFQQLVNTECVTPFLEDAIGLLFKENERQVVV